MFQVNSKVSDPYFFYANLNTTQEEYVECGLRSKFILLEITLALAVKKNDSGAKMEYEYEKLQIIP